MGLLDKFIKITEDFAEQANTEAKKIKTKFEEQGGTEGLLNKASDKFDNISKKTNDYIDNLSEQNQKILNEQSNSLKATSKIFLNTAQTIIEDVIKTATKSSAEEENTSTTKKPKKSHTQLDYVNLLTIPLEIVLNHFNADKNKYPGTSSYDFKGKKIALQDDLWLFDNNIAKSGAISLTSLLLLLENNITPSYENLEKYNDEAIELLDKLKNSKDYEVKLSTWIHANTKKSNINNVEAEKPLAVKKTPAKKKAPTPIKDETIAKPIIKKTRAKKIVPESDNIEKPIKKNKPKNN